jgi:hypothetical protein
MEFLYKKNTIKLLIIWTCYYFDGFSLSSVLSDSLLYLYCIRIRKLFVILCNCISYLLNSYLDLQNIFVEIKKIIFLQEQKNNRWPYSSQSQSRCLRVIFPNFWKSLKHFLFAFALFKTFFTQTIRDLETIFRRCEKENFVLTAKLAFSLLFKCFECEK